jgi:hypothetical protein
MEFANNPLRIMFKKVTENIIQDIGMTKNRIVVILQSIGFN